MGMVFQRALFKGVGHDIILLWRGSAPLGARVLAAQGAGVPPQELVPGVLRELLTGTLGVFELQCVVFVNLEFLRVEDVAAPFLVALLLVHVLPAQLLVTSLFWYSSVL